MTVQIDTTAEIDAIRLKTEGAHPATPSSGHVLLYYVTGTASPGLYTELSNGQRIGPFITGSSSSGGSGGGGMIYITPSAYFASVGTWAWLTDALFYNSSAGNGDYLDYYVYLAAGNYTIAVNYAANGDRAIMEFLVDGVSAGTIDTNGSGDQHRDISKTFTVASSGRKTFRLAVNGKTGSAYILVFRELALFQTG